MLTTDSTPVFFFFIDTAPPEIYPLPLHDALPLSLSPSAASGKEDTAIALNILPALAEVDADAVLSIRVAGVPAGVSLSAGTLNGDGSYTLTPAQLAGLSRTDERRARQVGLSRSATTHYNNNAATAASTTATLHVNVPPFAVAQTHSASPASGREDAPPALNPLRAPAEVDADAVLSIRVAGVPAGVSLSAGTLNGDGSYTLTPAQLAGLS